MSRANKVRQAVKGKPSDAMQPPLNSGHQRPSVQLQSSDEQGIHFHYGGPRLEYHGAQGRRGETASALGKGLLQTSIWHCRRGCAGVEQISASPTSPIASMLHHLHRGRSGLRGGKKTLRCKKLSVELIMLLSVCLHFCPSLTFPVSVSIGDSLRPDSSLRLFFFLSSFHPFVSPPSIFHP
ncbi:hypothetical protein BO71DRAFT_214636 [Aspergillus ellipticus CBS 707.79]|uniref:Uncharacterized protein n=1 Tax=Aspergillus ellipticus CBS 707.79 TaxID=1448320 RepID=A0A319DLP1_9EURO|nr:hypothetical protein BO71DRAFT_214636 [Aspergillus ellipticus CBS 707.79]